MGIRRSNIAIRIHRGIFLVKEDYTDYRRIGDRDFTLILFLFSDCNQYG